MNRWKPTLGACSTTSNGFVVNGKGAQRAVRQAKKEPSWSFSELQSSPKRLAELEKRIGREIKIDLQELSTEIAENERQIDRWKSSPKPRKRQASSFTT